MNSILKISTEGATAGAQAAENVDAPAANGTSVNGTPSQPQEGRDDPMTGNAELPQAPRGPADQAGPSQTPQQNGTHSEEASAPQPIDESIEVQRARKAHTIMRGNSSIQLYLEFLHRFNHADLLVRCSYYMSSLFSKSFKGAKTADLQILAIFKTLFHCCLMQGVNGRFLNQRCSQLP